MTVRLIGAIIALLVVAAVAVTSLRLISFSFQEQASPDGNQALQQAQRDGVQNTPDAFMQVQEARETAEVPQQADLVRQLREAEHRQGELRQSQDEERKLAEARRQAEQRERGEAQQREADLTRRLEEQRKLAQVWLQEEQERQLREAEQLEADLRRMREDERKLGLQPEKQRPQREAEPVRKSEGTVAAGQLQPDGKSSPERKTDASPTSSTSEAPSIGQRQHASETRANGKREKKTTICMLFGQPAANVERTGGSPMRGKTAGGPSLRGTTVGNATAEKASSARTRVRQASWQVQALMQGR